MQWVDAGDISELVAGSPSICVQCKIRVLCLKSSTVLVFFCR